MACNVSEELSPDSLVNDNSTRYQEDESRDLSEEDKKEGRMGDMSNENRYSECDGEEVGEEHNGKDGYDLVDFGTQGENAGLHYVIGGGGDLRTGKMRGKEHQTPFIEPKGSDSSQKLVKQIDGPFDVRYSGRKRPPTRKFLQYLCTCYEIDIWHIYMFDAWSWDIWELKLVGWSDNNVLFN